MSDDGGVLSDHGVHGEIDDLARRVAAIELSDEDQPHRERIDAVLDYAATRVRAARAPVVSPSMLDNVSEAVSAVVGFVGQREDGSVPSLEQAATTCDGVVAAVSFLPPPTPVEEVEAVGERASEFRDNASAMLDELAETKNALSGELDTLRAQLEESRAAAAAETEALNATIAEQTTRLDSELENFKMSSATAVAQARTNFDTASEDVRARGEAALAAFDEQRQTDAEEYSTSAEAIVRRLEELRDEAANLVGTVTGTATAGHFKVVADEERKTADTWRRWSVAAVIAVVAVGLWVLLVVVGDDDVAWSQVAGKAFVSIPLAALAAYAGRQSSEHRAAERRARHSQLQLAALEAYAEGLDEAEALKARAQLASHLFGPPPPPSQDKEDQTVGASDLMKLLEQLLKR